MKYPFLLAALLLCSANLAARHPDTDTLLQPDTLSSGNPTRTPSTGLTASECDAPTPSGNPTRSPPRNPTHLSSARPTCGRAIP